MFDSGGESIFNPLGRVFLLGGAQLFGGIVSVGANVLLVQREYISAPTVPVVCIRRTTCDHIAAAPGYVGWRWTRQTGLLYVPPAGVIIQQDTDFAAGARRRQCPTLQRRGYSAADAVAGSDASRQKIVVQQVVQGYGRGNAGPVNALGQDAYGA